MGKMKFTPRNIASLTLPAGKQETIFWDDDVAGFGLRLREGGSRTWVYRYRVGGTQRSMKLGNGNSVSLAIARKNASELEAQVRLGKDPAGQKVIAKQESEYTFELLAERFLDARRPELAQATIHEYERHLRQDAKSLHRLPITVVTQADIARLLNNAAGPVSANRLRSTLSAMFTWTMKEGVVLPRGNPAAFTHKREERARDRVLSDTAIKAVWNACGDDDYARVLRLLLLTGARAEEISCLRWGEVTDGAINLPSERTKNRRPHSIPLSKPAKSIIADLDRGKRVHVFGRDDTGFYGWAKCKQRLDEKLGTTVTPWRVHDLRRTAASGMQRLGIRVEVIERALNHVSGSYRGVAGIYQRDPLADDVRDALERWGRHIADLIIGRKSVVVPMKRA
jgi:integrase